MLAAKHLFGDAAAFSMDMAFAFFKTADNNSFGDSAAFSVDMAGSFLKTAGKFGFGNRFACFVMDMSVIGLFRTDKFGLSKAFSGMGMIFAELYLFVTSFAVLMFFNSTESFNFLGDGGKDKHIGSTEYDHAHHST